MNQPGPEATCERTGGRIDRAWLEAEGTLVITAHETPGDAKVALDTFLKDVSPTHGDRLRVHIAAIAAQASAELTKAAGRASSKAEPNAAETTGDAVLYARKYRIQWRDKSRGSRVPTAAPAVAAQPQKRRKPRESRVGLFLVRPCLRSCTSAVFRIPAYKFIAGGDAPEGVIAPRYAIKSNVTVVACACEDDRFCDACMCRNQLRRKREADAGQTSIPQTDTATTQTKRWMCQCCKHLFCLDDAHAAKISPSGSGGGEMRNARYVAKAACLSCVAARGCRRSRSRTNGHVVTTMQARASQSAPYATLRAGVFFHPESNKDMKETLLLEYGGQRATPRVQVAARLVRTEQGTSQANSEGNSQGISEGNSEGTSHVESSVHVDEGAAKAAEAAETAADQMSESESRTREVFAPQIYPVIKLVRPRARRVSPRTRTPKTGFV